MISGWHQRFGPERGVAALAADLFVYGFGEELWFRYLPVYLRALGASALAAGAFGTLKDLLDAGNAYPGGVILDRLGSAAPCCCSPPRPAAFLAERAEKKPFVVLTYAFFTLFPIAIVLSRSFALLAAAFVVGGLREIGEPARKALIADLAAGSDPGRTVGLYYSIRGFAVAGAAAIGGALWTVRPALTFVVATALGAAGTLWAAIALPGAGKEIS